MTPLKHRRQKSQAGGFKFRNVLNLMGMLLIAAFAVAALILSVNIQRPSMPGGVLMPPRGPRPIPKPTRRAGIGKGGPPLSEPVGQPMPSTQHIALGNGQRVTMNVPGYNFQAFFSPAPPTPPPWVLNLRGCTCATDWQDRKAKGESGICTCGVACPAHVDPLYLTEAPGQYVCSSKEHTGYDCRAECRVDGQIFWYAEGCGGPGQKACPPLAVTPSSTPTGTPSARASIVVPRTTWTPEEVYDFRGGGCELLNGEKRCYMEDRQGRELCPDYVTIDYLTQGPPEYPQCAPSQSHQYYCTIQCQEGNQVVRWGVHDIEDCHKPENFGNCPPRPTVVPKAQFEWREWTEEKRPKTECQVRSEKGEEGFFLPELTVGLLTHEPRSFADSMATYERYGLFKLVPEFIVYINNRGPATDAVAAEYEKKYPGVIKVLGDQSNKGIARGLVELTNAATKPYFLFLERDFQLIEPSVCVSEQLQAGVDLVKSKAADVVRYRSKWHAGRPNWALRFFYGHEDDAFRGRQPNLGCNVHYWIEHPDERWPEYVWKCGVDPEMLCTDSFYCNWTNNPQIWGIEWWNREYVSRFDKFVHHSPWNDLEYYMNWEPNSWNDRGFIVAQGEGLFKHMDRGNIVHVR